MKIKAAFVIAGIVSLVFVSSKMAFSQVQAPDQAAQPQEPSVNVEQGGMVPQAAVKQEPEAQWVWGEVVTVDLQNKTVSVKYLDYESDQEKEMSIAADDKTTFENVKSIDELKPKDTVSIDYTVQDGKNIAKNISVEKPETQTPPEAQTPPAEMKPQDTAVPQQAPVEQQVPIEQQAQPASPSGN